MTDEQREHVTPEVTERAPATGRRGRPGWLIPITLSCVALGIVGTVVVASLASHPDPTTGTANEQSHASVAAATMWFDPPFTASASFASLGVLQHNDIGSQDVRFALHGVGGGDVWVGRTDKKLCLLFADATDDAITRGEVTCVPYPGNLTTQGIDSSQVRLVYTQNMAPVRVWIAQQGTTGLCLIATTEQKGHLSQMNCVTLDEFRASGISIAAPGLAASWDGKAVLTSR